jgi:integrase
MAKLTKAFVDKVAIPATGYVLYWDQQDTGFGLRVTATGKRTYIVQGRVNGKSARLTIGTHNPWTAENARTAARDLLMSMDKGTDPRESRKEAAAAKVTLGEVAEAYLRDRALKESSKGEIRRHVATTFAAWQAKPIAAINREAVTKRFNEMKTKGLRGEAPAPSQANQGFAILRALINYAIREYRKPDGSPLLTDNPVDVLYKKWAPMKPRTSRIPDSKVGAVWSMLRQSREAAHNRDTLASIDLVMFLILTGARIGEACALTWDRVNLTEGWWHIPDPKNANPVWLPLSKQASELLTTRQRVEGSPYVFTSWGKCGHIIDPRDMMKKVTEAAGTKLTPHDLRRSFTTIGVALCGIDLHKIELLTNHVPRGVTARHYLETSHLQYLKPEVQRIADWITGQCPEV